MNETEAAWLAGLMEGEGYFVLTTKRPPRKDGLPSMRQATIGVKMTDLDIIERLRTITGVGRLYHNINTTGLGKKVQHSWVVNKRMDQIALLEIIRPYMGERRGAKIDEVLAHLKENFYKRPPAAYSRICPPGCTCGRHRRAA